MLSSVMVKTQMSAVRRACLINETIRRLEFLNRQVKIAPGHWGGWDLLTYPSDIYIEFNKDMTKASVGFSMLYMGGMAIMKRESSGWRIEESGIVAME